MLRRSPFAPKGRGVVKRGRLEVSSVRSDILLSAYYRLHPTHASVFQHHLDAVRVGRALRENSCDGALRQFSRGLVLLFDYIHSLTGLDLTSIGCCHIGPIPPDRATAAIALYQEANPSRGYATRGVSGTERSGVPETSGDMTHAGCVSGTPFVPHSVPETPGLWLGWDDLKHGRLATLIEAIA